MSKMSSNGFMPSDAVQQRVVSGHPVHTPDWEQRLTEARAKREKALLAQNRVAAEKAAAAKTAEASCAASDQDESTPFWAAFSGAKVLKGALIFSGAAGFGFGIILGIGVLIGAGGAPILNGTFTANTSVAEAARGTVALGVPDEADAVVATALPAAAPAVAAAPAIFDGPLPVLQPTPDPVTDVTLPAITPVLAVSAEGAPVTTAPMLYLPEHGSALARQAAFGAIPAPIQYFIHAPDGVPNGRLQGYVAQLAANGVEVAEIGRETFRVSATHLRYYSPDTAQAAMTVAADLGVEARDFSENSVNSSRIEIWIAGRPKPTEQADAEGGNAFFSRLRDSLRKER